MFVHLCYHQFEIDTVRVLSYANVSIWSRVFGEEHNINIFKEYAYTIEPLGSFRSSSAIANSIDDFVNWLQGTSSFPQYIWI